MRFADERPQLTKDRLTYVYYPRTQMVPENVAVKVLNRQHTITVEADIPAAIIGLGPYGRHASITMRESRLCGARQSPAWLIWTEVWTHPGPSESYGVLVTVTESTGNADLRASLQSVWSRMQVQNRPAIARCQLPVPRDAMRACNT